MPAKDKTPTVGLNRWIGTENPNREGFVEDNDEVEALGSALLVANLEAAALKNGGSYAATKETNGWVERILVGSVVRVQRTSTKTANGWAVQVLMNKENGAQYYSKTMTYTKKATGWEMTTA